MKRYALLLPLALLFLYGCGGKKAEKSKVSDMKTETTEAPAQTAPQTTPPETPGSGDEVAVISTKFGDMVIEFYPDVAPNHVANFKKLAKSGFYDGCTFHRVIPNFMIQGGDPLSKDNDRSNDGKGGPGYSINAEFNARKHLRGTLSMARGQDPNSASSQFFICVASIPHLDGQYTIFGQVIKGLEVIDKIVNVPRDERDNPLDPVVMTKVSIVPRSQAVL